MIDKELPDVVKNYHIKLKSTFYFLLLFFKYFSQIIKFSKIFFLIIIESIVQKFPKMKLFELTINTFNAK